MNCVANILHKICNASVFFSAYRTCYNSIVKIEQKRKSAFFRGRSFCLEVVEISREERDVYLIPQNFVDTGTILGGTVKLRNAVEAAVLAVGSAVPLFYLPLAFNIRLMIVIAVSVPLGVFGVVGIGGDSLTQFVAHWFRFMKRRRIVTPTPQGNLEANRHRHLRFISKRYRVIYYDDADTLPHNAQVLQRKADRHGKLVKRQTLYDLLPIEKIENGILHTTDDRYIKILEIEPINFLLRSPREQRSVIYSFASLLKVSPVRLQFKSFSRKADVNAYLDKLRRDAANEPDAAVRKRHMSYIRFVKRLGSRDAVSRRFFVIFQYEAPTNERNISYAEIVSTLETTARNFRTYLAQCGNAIVEHENEDEFLTDVFYTLLNRRTAVQISLQERIQDVLASYLAQNDATALDKIPPAAFMIPPSLDLKHGRYLCIDGTYHAYLMIPADGYRAQVTAGWMALLVNAGEGIDVDLFLERQPKERMMQKIGQQIRINRSKIKDTSDTNSDFDDLSNAIRSGYYLKDGLANNEDFYYAAILVTVTAASVKDLEWRIGEIRKLMVSQDMNLQLCSFRQEAAFLSSLLLCSPDAALFKKYRRNILTSTAASFYPFVSFELCDTNGVLLGVNKYNNSLVSLDNFNTRIYKNANMAILGTSGAGKTFTMQLIARRMRLAGTPALHGWLGWLAVLYAICMLLDCVTGTALAVKEKTWNSSKARKGLWHKGGSTIMICVSVLTDIFLGLVINHVLGLQLPFDYDMLLTPVVLTWYIATELGSILENAAEMGVPVPPVLREVLEKVHKASDRKDTTASAGHQDE